MLQKDTIKHIKKALELTISKDQTRPQLMGVYYCPDRALAVSSNGYQLTMSTHHYQSALAGLIVNYKEMETIDREFLKYQAVIPSKDKCTHATVTIGKQYAQKVRNGNMPVYFYATATDLLEVSYDKRDGYLFAINAPLMFPVAIDEALTVRYVKDSPLSPVHFGFDSEYKHSVVIMPLKV